MNIQQVLSRRRSKAQPTLSSRQSKPDFRLKHPWLGLAWTICGVLVIVNVGLYFYSTPAYLTQLHHTCIYVACNAGQLTPQNVHALSKLGLSLGNYSFYFLTYSTLISLVFFAVGLLIFWHRNRDLIGIYISLILILFGAIFIDGRTGAVLLPVPIETIFGFIAGYLVYPALGLVFYIFPDGRFVPRWSWVFMLVWLAVAVEYNLPSTSFLNYANLSPLLQIIETIIQFGSAFGIMIYRYVRHFDRQQHQQTKWVLFISVVTFLIIFPLTNLNLFFPALSNPDSLYQLANATVIAQIFYLSIPLAFVIAILRYHLWDIDIVINRTLVYGTLTISVIVLYILVVLGFGSLIQARGNLLLSLLATGLIAVLFQPSRQRLQQGVNRLMYGERDEPYRILSRLGQRLEASLTPEAVLPTIVETVAQALKLPFAAITQVVEGVESTRVAVYGELKEQADCTNVPLVYQHETVGELTLAPRHVGEFLTPADQRFLRDLAPQIGVAVHAVRLTADLKQLTIDLQHSRERLVTAREEERRRLRRDLHDGLGPQLSSQTLTLAAARKLLRHDPDAADTLLADAIAHAQTAIADIRRLVYALRPPALDDLGLIAAIQEQIHQYRSSGVMLILDAPESLSPMPAAVEVACYRILQEALTNVIRHAHAHTCTISLLLDKQLVLEVRDDGQGLPPTKSSGVGLSSMRERAEELGGTCVVESLPDKSGTCVVARLPLL